MAKLDNDVEADDVNVFQGNWFAGDCLGHDKKKKKPSCSVGLLALDVMLEISLYHSHWQMVLRSLLVMLSEQTGNGAISMRLSLLDKVIGTMPLV